MSFDLGVWYSSKPMDGTEAAARYLSLCNGVTNANRRIIVEVSEAEPQLRRMLSEAGFSFQKPDPLKAWEVFKAFVREPVDCSHDGVLFECGVYDWTGQGERFYFGFVRQFSIDVDGEYDHMEQLHCKFNCPPLADSNSLVTNLWLETFGDDYDRYFKAVESLPEFRQGLRLSGWECKIEQFEI